MQICLIKEKGSPINQQSDQVQRRHFHPSLCRRMHRENQPLTCVLGQMPNVSLTFQNERRKIKGHDYHQRRI